MPPFRTLPAVLLAAALIDFSFPAFAQAPSEQDDAATEMARERFREGVRYYDQKQYEKARAAFLQAYALKQHPAVLLNLAQSELRSGHEADAATHFAEFLRTQPAEGSPEQAEAKKGLAAAEEKVAEVEVSAPEAGFQVLVDGEQVGVTPLPGPLYLSPGEHQIEGRKGDVTSSQRVIAEPGATSSVDLAAQPPKAPAGALENEGDEFGEAASFDLEEDGQGFFGWFADTPGAWVGAGVTALGIAGGVGFGLTARNRYDRADNIAAQIRARAAAGDPPASDPNAPCANLAPNDPYANACQTYLDRVDEGDRFKTFAIASWVVAGVGAAGTVLYYVFDSGSNAESRGKRSTKTAVLPVMAPHYAGMSVLGEF